MQCVVLAGGLGTRMRPFTDDRPKALIPIEGRPFVDHQLAHLAAHGVTDVVLSIGYRGEALRAHVGDGARFGLRVVYVDEGTKLRGTAGALRLALDEGALAERFLVIYGDSFLPIDFEDVYAAFERAGKPALMTVFRNEGRWDTSNAIFDGRLVTCYDKQRRTRPAEEFTFIDYGLGVLERRLIAERVAPEGRADLADLYFELARQGELAGYEANERFYEIGSPSGLEDFARRVREGR
jgi:NDP-sugar pyrophosphorylase family protein